MGNFTMVVPKTHFHLALGSDEREKSAHTYTHSPRYVPSLDILQPQHGHPGKNWTAAVRRLRTHQQIRES